LQEAEELYDLREALELFAMEKAVVNVSDQALDELARKMNLYGADVQRNFSRERLIYDQDLHLEIARLSGNDTLLRTLTQVFERIILKRRTDGLYDPARGLTAHHEHLHLVEAMKRRDAARAVDVLRAHIRAGKDNVLGDLRHRQHIRELHGAAVFAR
jgi:DNA-binding GntR family transcriptional regulator